MSHVLKHWLKFNAVGIIGVGVQLIVLTLLTGLAGLNVLLATVIAVESAVLHNFIWHERWTWIDRTHGLPDGMLLRLVRFNLANGLISLVGNLGLMWVFVSRMNLHYLPSNMAAIVICSLVNFLVSDRWVFHRT